MFSPHSTVKNDNFIQFVLFRDFVASILQLYVSFELLSDSFEKWKFWTCILKAKANSKTVNVAIDSMKLNISEG